MKYKYLFSIFSLLIITLGQAQRVGINTENPSRTLEVNGNVRVTDLKTKTNVAGFENLLSANKNNGNVDYIEMPSLLQSDKNNMEVSRVLYNATAPDINKVCGCGDMSIRFNGASAEFRLDNDNVFKSNKAITSFNLSYGIKRFTDDTYSYANKTNVTFSNTNATAADYYTKYRKLDDTTFSTSNTIRIYTIVLPKQGNLYRLTLTRLLNASGITNYGIICEKFYVQEI